MRAALNGSGDGILTDLRTFLEIFVAVKALKKKRCHLEGSYCLWLNVRVSLAGNL